MRFLSIFILIFASLILTACEPNPIIRVQSVPTKIFSSDASSRMLGTSIAYSSIVDKSKWTYNKRSFTYFVTSRIKIKNSSYKNLKLNIDSLYATIFFTSSIPDKGTKIDMLEYANIEISINGKQYHRRSPSHLWITAIANSNVKLLENIINSIL